MKPADIFNPITIGLLVLIVAAAIAGFVLIPADSILPVHWGPTGVADGFMPRDGALLLPVGISLALLVIIAAVGRFAAPERLEPGRYLMRAIIPAMLLLFLVIAVGTVLIGMGVVVDMVRLIVAAFGVLLVIMGNMLPKTRPNSYAGIRLASAMNDPALWQSLHRAAGMACLGCGVALIALAAMTGNTMVLLAGIVVACLLPLVVGILATRSHRPA